MNNKLIFRICIPTIIVLLILIAILIPLLIRQYSYRQAIKTMDAGEYEEAISLFEDLDDYKDATDLILECNNAIAYEEAISYFDLEQWNIALKIFLSIDITFRDCSEKIDACNENLSQQYLVAMTTYNAGQFEEALILFEALDDYQDAEDMVEECNNCISLQEDYNTATELYENKSYDDAKDIFISLGDFYDATTMVEKCNKKLYAQAKKYYENGDFDNAAILFAELGDYDDAADMVTVCFDEKQKEEENKENYNKAYEYYNRGDYETARDMFVALGDYSNAAEMASKCDGMIVKASDLVITVTDFHTAGPSDYYMGDSITLTGTIKNTSAVTVKDMQLTVDFKDKNGNILDTKTASSNYNLQSSYGYHILIGGSSMVRYSDVDYYSEELYSGESINWHMYFSFDEAEDVVSYEIHPLKFSY